MLRIAVPNKGSLSEPTIQILTEAGYQARRRGRELYLRDQENDVELFFLRPRDIAVYVGAGRIQAGITGRDLLLDSGTQAVEYLPLGFAKSNFRFAAPAGQMRSIRDLQGKRIAASYDRLVGNYLAEQGIDVQVVHLDGAVESSVQLGVADAIADVVETGSTLKAAGLEIFGDPILHSEAVLITTTEHWNDPSLKVLERRIRGVLVARNHVLVDYMVHEDNLGKVAQITPGIESPTISPLAEPNWKAVRVVVSSVHINQVMDELAEAGAKGIIVTELLASRIA